jgi:CheY-like chemotaxis protein
MNTLNNIHALVDIDAEAAKQTVLQLSDMMRYVVYDTGGNFISLKDDIRFVKNYIELMNGTIAVESEKDKGTTFTVTVTLTDSDHKNNGDEEDPELVREKADLKGRRVLLAEDVPINADIMIMVLSMREIEAEHAENGRIAVEMFAEHEAGYYDAILMDMRMPEMDGLEATRKIRAMDRPDAKSIPIIALTANAFDEDVQHSMQAGLNTHLSKPVEPDVLFETLEGLLS